jgi:mannose-1-phosphate guanylyltransferase/mannose-6-phosphate isomerase
MLHPVIMCGGSGMRLWPASRPERPKPFIPLVGGRSTFSLTLDRVRALKGAAAPIVVAGAAHAPLIRAELEAAGLTGLIVVEPEPRDSAPAMAAAAALVEAGDPDGVCLFLAADHLIPDVAAFAAVAAKAQDAAAGGAIVPLGVAPTEPSTAYGYIRPGAGDAAAARPVAAFVEKPDAARAAALIAEGCLWNSGMFIARADALMAELRAHAPAIGPAVAAAIEAGAREGAVLVLGEAFRAAPKISIDYAVMERTTDAVVLRADFSWSDLGAWPAILEAAPKDAAGNAIMGEAQVEETSGSLIYAEAGIKVAVRGVKDLAIVAEPGAVLVTALSEADRIKALVERTLAAEEPAPASVWRGRYETWFEASALPLWWSLGADHEHGGFREQLGLDAKPVPGARRMRVQPRQAYVFAEAGLAGWTGPWRQAVQHGLLELRRSYLRPDGLYRTQLADDRSVKDETAKLYDQAFVLLALTRAYTAGIGAEAAKAEALALLARIGDALSLASGGYREHEAQAYQSNPHMHLLEAALAWREAAPGAPWDGLVRDLVGLATTRFIDAEAGLVREFFDEDWSPSSDVILPGHQFEWAWLLGRTGEAPLLPLAQKLYAAGDAGVDRARQAAVDEVDANLAPVRRTARLWPQTERLKAACLLSRLVPASADRYLADAAAAAQGLWRYFEDVPAGLYRDRQDAAGAFVAEPAPASSLYHLWGALAALRSL